MGFQIQICTVLRVFWSILVNFCVANELQQNSNTSSREEYIQQILTVLLELLRFYI